MLDMKQNHRGDNSDQSSDRFCIVCFERLRTVLLPCAHVLLCEDCATNLLKSANRVCPTCRTPFEKFAVSPTMCKQKSFALPSDYHSDELVTVVSLRRSHRRHPAHAPRNTPPPRDTPRPSQPFSPTGGPRALPSRPPQPSTSQRLWHTLDQISPLLLCIYAVLAFLAFIQGFVYMQCNRQGCACSSIGDVSDVNNYLYGNAAFPSEINSCDLMCSCDGFVCASVLEKVGVRWWQMCYTNDTYDYTHWAAHDDEACWKRDFRGWPVTCDIDMSFVMFSVGIFMILPLCYLWWSA